MDIEYELYNALFNGQGHWVLYRWFDTTKYSKYWDVSAKEAIGGPKWEWKDYPIRTSYRMGTSVSPGPGGSATPYNSNYPGKFDIGERTYIIQNCYRPKIGDYIMEYDCDYSDEVSEFTQYVQTYAPVAKYRIYHKEPVRADFSKIGYYLVFTRLDNVEQ
ncbi:MAG: hypothetical protein B7C24_13910 [Bacteroidetes bacterium 4572_77]|nr:MAG: hypothetical protein B7C24_13910 [Bacteroidetes bacterium 4572_77]